MRFRQTALILATCLLAGSALAASPSRSGYFDSVRVSPETGDEGGIRIQVNDGPSPTVDFVLCEGSCHDYLRFPAKIEGDRLTFTYSEPLFDVKGVKSGETRAKVEGRFVSRGLLLKMDFLESSHDNNNPYQLIPRRKRQP